MGITRDIAHYVASARYEDLPPNVVRLAKQLVLDDIGCAFGGQFTEEARIFINHVKELGGKPEVTIAGDGSKIPCVNSGVNVFLANMLDYDTIYRNYTISGSVPTWTAIAMAERQEASGKDVITAAVAGYDIHNRIGDATQASLKLRPRYDNMSYQVFGAMTAASMILGLDEDQICDAIGIAGYTAPVVNLNLWFKALPCSPIKGAVYWQCKRGIQATLLAQRGFMGPPGLLDDKEWGYGAGVSDQFDYSQLTHKLGEEYYIDKYLTFKLWSCCGELRPGIGMIQSIIEEEKIDPVDMEEVVYKQFDQLVEWAPFHIQMPKDEFEAMYSVPWALATMALGYQPGPDWFARERRDDTRVQQLVKRIRFEEDPECTVSHNKTPERSFAKLVVRAKGKVYHRQTEYAKGDRRNPLTQEEIETKFRNMATLVVSDKQRETIIDIVNHLEDLGNVRELTREFARSV